MYQTLAHHPDVGKYDLSSIEACISGAAPLAPEVQRDFEAVTGGRVVEGYGLTEASPVTHCNPVHGERRIGTIGLPFPSTDARVADPDSGEPLPPGEVGELVLTSLTKEALPVLRYRTRDLTALDPEPCACGRTLVRIARITGRTDDMLIVRGVNVYPSQVEHALMQVGDVAPHYLLVLRRVGALDALEVRVETRPEVVAAGEAAMAIVAATVRRRLHEVIGLTADVTLVPPRTLERSAGKARRVEDLRR
jgi:phenylacetate-CoA ligase